jgi:CheY-like chemotaxis protein
MSSSLSFDHLADIRDGARRMVERTRAHEGDLNQLVETAHGVARHATASTVALTRADTNADGLSRLCSDQARLSVENAAAAVRACAGAREQHIDAHRLLDLTMPVLNGLEATRLITATHATRQSRVIAYTRNDSIPPPLERWFVAVVPKPSPPDVVLAAVQDAVSL